MAPAELAALVAAPAEQVGRLGEHEGMVEASCDCAAGDAAQHCDRGGRGQVHGVGAAALPPQVAAPAQHRACTAPGMGVSSGVPHGMHLGEEVTKQTWGTVPCRRLGAASAGAYFSRSFLRCPCLRMPEAGQGTGEGSGGGRAAK